MVVSMSLREKAPKIGVALKIRKNRRRHRPTLSVARALDLDGKDSAVLYNVGCLYAILGRPADALRCLKKVLRSGWRKEWIKLDPDWTALRGLKEFVALVS
jgi:hypothetical protein